MNWYTEDLDARIGKHICEVKMEKYGNQQDVIVVNFGEHGVVTIKDEPCCCESRYTSTDDDLPQFSGAIFLGDEVRDAPNVDCEYEEHEVQFYILKTDRGNITFQNHNEHNGYYGGFSLKSQVTP